MGDDATATTGVVRRHVVVVGAGVAGLAAAWYLRRDGGPGLRVTVLEQSPQVGGKLRVSEVAGVPVDEGAESLLLRRPEGLAIVEAGGLSDDMEDAATTAAAIWTRGELRPMPAGTVMGIPTDLRPLARSGILTAGELARIPADAWLPGPRVHEDVTVGRYVTRRLGRAVVERLVEPLLGGVYAGRADLLSLEATLPQLAPHVRRHRSLLAAARASRGSAPPAGGAVFGALRGGLGRLPAGLARRSGATVRTDTTVRELRRTPEGWALTVGSAHDLEEIRADAVVLAVPPAAAARLLRPDVPAAAAELAPVRTASMAVLTLAFGDQAFARRPTGSGFLVPPVEGRVVKAATFSSNKWAWYGDAAPGLTLVRLSVGRLDEEADLQRPDAELVEVALADLTDALGVTDPPVDVRVTRWGGALPQYAVGHRARVRRIRSAVARHPGLAVCGATYDGIGIPACVASAERAAAEVLRQWAT
ncbi:MAG: protoporphyrinogen/coproporphyrinogen oxidase [Actinomycetota bacterium]|jgi:oxygen-dependent protoporphyrinogen oxidase|nr:protoporphyrinogen/coproporphyrinogen oxidase [Actinomycetota bacterium]